MRCLKCSPYFFHRLRFFPPKQVLLTEEEYILQGVKETAKGLDELKAYCSSPECDSWKLVKRLKNPIQ